MMKSLIFSAITTLFTVTFATYIPDIPLSFTKAPPNEQCGISSVPQGRIIAGVEAKPGAWPWMVSINFKGQRSHFCGASLISPKWVLTAAHCAGFRNAKDIDVILGEHDRYNDEGTEQRINVKRVILHENYIFVSGRLENDIALLELERPAIITSRTQPVCLPPEGVRPPIGSKCYLPGWGQMNENHPPAKILQQAILPVVDKRHCFNTNHYLCTGYGKDSLLSSCRGDSGGPLVCQNSDGRWVQQGVVSFVVTICKYYTGSMPVGRYRDWIRFHSGV